MDSSDRIQGRRRRLSISRWRLNDLRQGLAIVQDFYNDFEHASEDCDAAMCLEKVMAPLFDDDRDFNGIWSFHRELFVADPSAHIPYAEMYDTFVRYCKKTRRMPVEQEVFEFIFARMENPVPYLTGANGRGAGSCPAENNYPAFS